MAYEDKEIFELKSPDKIIYKQGFGGGKVVCTKQKVKNDLINY